MSDLDELIAFESQENKTNRWPVIAVAVVAIVFVGILAFGMKNAAVDRPDEEAPDFEMQFFTGYEWENQATASLSDFKGRPVILNFWASWCVECRVEADLLERTWQVV